MTILIIVCVNADWGPPLLRVSVQISIYLSHNKNIQVTLYFWCECCSSTLSVKAKFLRQDRIKNIMCLTDVKIKTRHSNRRVKSEEEHAGEGRFQIWLLQIHLKEWLEQLRGESNTRRTGSNSFSWWRTSIIPPRPQSPVVEERAAVLACCGGGGGAPVGTVSVIVSLDGPGTSAMLTVLSSPSTRPTFKPRALHTSRHLLSLYLQVKRVK